MGILEAAQKAADVLWLCSIGFAQKYDKKGVYFDGHEKQDVA